RRVRARGRSFPIVLRQPGGRVAGAVSPVLRPAELAWLRAYEGPEYALIPCRPVLADGSTVVAGMFRPAARLAAGPEPWDLALWQALEKPRYIEMLRRGGGHG